jgi:hypothetical protein
MSGCLSLVPFTMRAITGVCVVVFIDSAKDLLDLITNSNVSDPTRDNVIYIGLIAAVILIHVRADIWVKGRLRG